MFYTLAQLSKRAEGNMALDITELCQRDNFVLTDYLGSMVESYYIDGKPYCLPNIIGCTLFTFLPVLFSLFISFTDWDYTQGFGNWNIIGLQNFVDI